MTNPSIRKPAPRHSHESGNLESRGFQSFPIDSRRVGGLDSRLRGNDEFRDCGVVGNDKFRDYGVVGNDGSGISTPAPRLSTAGASKMPSEGSDGIGIGESEAVAHAQ
ncbi:hypothetical protein COI01_12550 [Neisseria meningitidis]|nr:hypothetical protein COI01_12550 [Neisseria meningitidis]